MLFITTSLDYWQNYLTENGINSERADTRFGDEVIRFADPDGMMLELITSPITEGVQPWPDSRVPVEHSLRGFHSVTAALEGYERTATLLTETFGYQLIEEV